MIRIVFVVVIEKLKHFYAGSSWHTRRVANGCSGATHGLPGVALGSLVLRSCSPLMVQVAYFQSSCKTLWLCRYWYMDGVSNELALRHIPEIDSRNDTLAGPYGRRGDQVKKSCLAPVCVLRYGVLPDVLGPARAFSQ